MSATNCPAPISDVKGKFWTQAQLQMVTAICVKEGKGLPQKAVIACRAVGSAHVHCWPFEGSNTRGFVPTAASCLSRQVSLQAPSFGLQPVSAFLQGRTSVPVGPQSSLHPLFGGFQLLHLGLCQLASSDLLNGQLHWVLTLKIPRGSFGCLHLFHLSVHLQQHRWCVWLYCAVLSVLCWGAKAASFLLVRPFQPICMAADLQFLCMAFQADPKPWASLTTLNACIVCASASASGPAGITYDMVQAYCPHPAS